MDIFGDCCEVPPNYCCGELPAPATMILQMTNWATAYRPRIYFGNPFAGQDEMTLDLTPLNGTHVLDQAFPLYNYGVPGTVYNSFSCRWGKVFQLPVTWTNRISLVTRTDNIVILAELRDTVGVSSRVSSVHLSVNYPTSEDVLGNWYATAWLADVLQFEVQGLSRYTSYPFPNFYLSGDIAQSVPLSAQCSAYDLDYPAASIATIDPGATLPDFPLTSTPNFAVVGP